MLEAAKFGDPVIGIDIHMVLVPAPPAPAPIPTPLPHPFVGVVFDPIGLAVGAAISAVFGGGGPVLVNMMPCGNTGTDVKGVPHFPTPPGVSFAPNDIPSNDGTLIFGSQTVDFAGSSIARLTDMVMTCNFPINLPTSVCMAVPMGAPVLVGGPPAMNWMAAVTKAIRTKWFSDKLHALLRAAPGSRLSKVICFLTGHPVDVVSGEVITDAVDFELPGPIPLRFERTYYSRSDHEGPLGRGWHHPLDSAVIDEGWRVTVRLPDGRLRWHDPLDVGASTFDPWDRYTLARLADGWSLATADGLTRRYVAPPGSSVARLVAVTDASENRIALEYDGDDLAWVVDSAGRQLHFTHARGRLTAVRARLGDASSSPWVELVRYEHEGRHLAAAYDPLGHALRYAYRGGVLVRETLRGGLSFYFEYDWEHPEGWCTRTWGDGGIFDRRMTYDKSRRVTVVEDSRGGRTIYYGNAAGLVSRMLEPTGGEWRYEYDAHARTVARVDPLGQRREWSYDARGEVTSEAAPEERVTRWSHAPRETEMTDPAGGVWRWLRDARGLASATVDPTGAEWTFAHDRHGALVEARDPLGGRVLRRYDARGCLEAQVDRDGRETRFASDPLGRVTEVAWAGRALTLLRDAAGRVREVRHGDGRVERTAWDADGNLAAYTDAGGRAWRFTYWGLGRLETVTAPDGAVFRHEYDREGNVVAMVDAAGRRRELRWDLSNRRVGEVDVAGRATTLQRDAAGRVTSFVDATERVTRFARDADGRVLRRKDPDGGAVEYRYDALGRVVEGARGRHKVELRRDPVGRVVSEVSPEGEVRRTYDALGRCVERRTSGHERTRYEYDREGRLVRLRSSAWPLDAPPVEDPAESTLRIERDDLGERLRAVQHGGGARGGWTLRTTRDPSGAATTLRLARGDDELVARGYRWNDSGEIDAVTDPAQGLTPRPHDAAGRLVTGAAAEPPTTFDARGRVEALGATTLRWSAAGHLTRVSRGDGREVTFDYDAFGRRVRKRSGDAECSYLWDGDELVHEAPSSGPPRTWVFEPDRYAPTLGRGEGVEWSVATEPGGSPLAVLDDGGVVRWSGGLDASGEAPGLDALPWPWRFPGQYRDGETGLSYNRFRYYDPTSRRYLSPDPLGVFGAFAGLDEYAYVPDPFVWIDPFGLAPQGMVEIFRAVSAGELADIRAIGAYRNIDISAGKYFSPSMSDVVKEARMLAQQDGIAYTITSTMVPERFAQKVMHTLEVDGGVKTLHLQAENEFDMLRISKKSGITEHQTIGCK